MAFFLEALLGGLMAGMLYALVALGFVLIFKASGVFNFAQGAMVLFAALAMARFSEWVPGWLGIEDKFLGNLMAFVLAAAIMSSTLMSPYGYDYDLPVVGAAIALLMPDLVLQDRRSWLGLLLLAWLVFGLCQYRGQVPFLAPYR
jgi:branched-subunit amino acid ABC-type transport system permease component